MYKCRHKDDLNEYFQMENLLVQKETGLHMNAVRTARCFFIKIGVIEEIFLWGRRNIKVNWEKLNFYILPKVTAENRSENEKATAENRSENDEPVRKSTVGKQKPLLKPAVTVLKSAVAFDEKTLIALNATLENMGYELDPQNIYKKKSNIEEEYIEEKKFSPVPASPSQDEKKTHTKHPKKIRPRSQKQVSKKSAVAKAEAEAETSLVPEDSPNENSPWLRHLQKLPLSPENIKDAWNDVFQDFSHRQSTIKLQPKRIAAIQNCLKQFPQDRWIKFFSELSNGSLENVTAENNTWFTFKWFTDNPENIENAINGNYRGFKKQKHQHASNAYVDDGEDLMAKVRRDSIPNRNERAK